MLTCCLLLLLLLGAASPPLSLPPGPSFCPFQPAGAFDGQPGSQLLLVGVTPLHGLYAALAALPWCEPGQPDVPLLCAPVPFLHAQLCPLRLLVSPGFGGGGVWEGAGWVV